MRSPLATNRTTAGDGPLIEVRELTKRFHGFTAVDAISFDCPEGAVFGLLGENGAGKTTTLRMLATLLAPTSGTAFIGGVDISKEPEKVRALLGVIFEGGVYDRLTARENIAYFGALYGLHGQELRRRVDAVIERLAMGDFSEKRAGALSRGMRQKVVIGRAIVHDPPVLLMDEPTASLDVTAANLVRDFILEAKAQGKTVLFSSHNMPEVERLCDAVAVIHKGRIVAHGSIEDLRSRQGEDDLERVFVRLVGEER